MDYGKIINNQLILFNPSDYNILGDPSPIAVAEGYKPVIYQTGNGGIYEANGVIYIETPEQVVSDWLHPERTLRVTVPVPLLFSSATWIALWGYVQAMDIPSYLINGNRVIYLETLNPAHEAFIDSQVQFGVIKETKPIS